MTMLTAAQRFYSQPAARPYTRQDLLGGRAIKLNPALITITDGLEQTTDPNMLQERVYAHVEALLDHHVRTFHVDINFPDYQGFGPTRPDLNHNIFTPAFLVRLNALVKSRAAFLNLHLLTAYPLERLGAFADIPFGAICFQLDAVTTGKQLTKLIDAIWHLGACVSPVIETIGSGRAPVATAEAVLARLEPVLPKIGMLTLQAAYTGARSHQADAGPDFARARSYIDSFRAIFPGTFQLQGGITTRTIAAAARLGAEFLVAGTELFHHPAGHAPYEVVNQMLQEVANSSLTIGERDER